MVSSFRKARRKGQRYSEGVSGGAPEYLKEMMCEKFRDKEFIP
ncbi:MAG TPA: hypothetical protein PLQ41_04310 [bacterium]|nr:hypothetical protein [bacterium]